MSKVWRAMVAMVFVSCVAMAFDANGAGTYADPNGAGTYADPNGAGTYADPNGPGTYADPNGAEKATA